MTVADRNRVSRRSLLLLFILVAASVLARMPGIQNPMLGYRPHDTAAVARNFYEHGMHILYPQIDWRGNSAGYVESEFQLYTYSVALLYEVLGPHEVIGRAVSVALYAEACCVLFALVRRLFDDGTALLAVLFYSMSTIVYYYSRSFQPDMLMALSSIVGLYYFWRWTETGTFSTLALSAVGVCVATLIKPFSLYLGLPLLYLAQRAFGWKMLRRQELWLFAITVIAPAVFWYRHSYHLWLDYGNTFGVFGGWVKYKIFPPDLRLTWSAIKELLDNLLILIATPVGCLLMLIGFFRPPPQRNYLLHVWGAGFMVAILLAAKGILAHDYYQMPVAFFVAAWMAHGLTSLWRSNFLSPRILRPMLVVACLAVVGFSLWRWQIRDARMTPREWDRVAFASRIARLTGPADPIVMVIPYRGTPDLRQHRTTEGEFLECDPTDFYRSHRFGWSLDDRLADVNFVETLHSRGARYFATAFPEILANHPDLKAALDGRYTAVEVTSHWAIYRLDREAADMVVAKVAR